MDEENYRAFLLRLWQEARGGPWRASVEDPHTGQRLSFASDEQLLAFLRSQMAAPDDAAATGLHRAAAANDAAQDQLPGLSAARVR